MRRLIVVVVLTPLWARLVAASDSALLQLQVIEGSSSVQTIGSKANRPLAVQVTDETGQPVEGAAVSFRMPDQEVTGAFKSGMKTEVVTTGHDGIASAWGMQWGRFPGELRIRVLAVKGPARAGTVIALQLQGSASKSGQRLLSPPRSSGRWRWIALSAGAAGAGLVAAALSGGAGASGGSGSPSQAGKIQIGPPQISVVRP
jgi:hypothetical protein